MRLLSFVFAHVFHALVDHVLVLVVAKELLEVETGEELAQTHVEPPVVLAVHGDET